ncbi:GAF domain-containing protein [Patulibacter sp.]|uniref:helix-turn-helix domain-containing protein n=1 Tax=Patulibacter sp. TaxID=1912859 RepID=UPI00271F0286|nr:helix-turn-helix domain-containing protein [Patulibacter sp.]MDO9406877.1 GAF domain-containing protein [Patulibacter sp.]
MANPWLAVDERTPPQTRARLLRRAWEGFVEGSEDSSGLRPPIAASWDRCQDAGVAHDGAAVAPMIADEDETAARWEAHPLQAVRPLIAECLAPIMDDSHLVVVADARGMLLWVDGPPGVRRAAEAMNFAPGTLWSESGAGTNAVGTALAADHAVQVFAAEHFHEQVQTWTCSACPVHDPDSGALLGVIDLTSRMSTVHPHALSVAVATARAVEMQLRSAMQEADARLVERLGVRVAGGREPRALVSAHGRVIAANPAWRRAALQVQRRPEDGRLAVVGADVTEVERVQHGGAFLVGPARTGSTRPAAPDRSPPRLDLLGPEPVVVVDGATLTLRRRQAEILALLVSSPDGLSVERLGAGLYGDHAKAGTVRVEVSRLRKLLGPWLTSEPYGLAPGCACDLRTLHDLLDAGAVREAAERHGVGLLPRSEAPGVVRVRDHLHAWVRESVLQSDDLEALWAWVDGSGGEDDLIAWSRFLRRLPTRDPRRPLAVARVSGLRRHLAAPA